LNDDGLRSYLLILMSFQKSSRFLLNDLMDAASTTDGGSWFQASMTLCEKKCFLMFSLYCLHNLRSCTRNSRPFDTSSKAGDDQYLPSHEESCKFQSSPPTIAVFPMWLNQELSIFLRNFCSSVSASWLSAEHSLTLVNPSPGRETMPECRTLNVVECTPYK